MGQETYKVSLKDVFGANRVKICQRLQAAGHSHGSIVLLGGPSETRFDSDHEPLFRQESYFWYLSGVKEPDCALRLDIETQEATLYVPKLPADYATIMGKIATLDEWKVAYCVDHALYFEDLQSDTLEALQKSSNGSSASLCK